MEFWSDFQNFWCFGSEMSSNFQNIKNFENRFKTPLFRSKLRFLVFLRFLPIFMWKKSQFAMWARVSKNRKNLIFEIWPFLGVKNTGEHDRTIGEMIWRRKRVENPFFSEPRVFSPLSNNIGSEKECRKEWPVSRK